MTTKFETISELAESTGHQVTKSRDEWKKYLSVTSNLYKYSFDEQLLIYGQKSDVTAVAAIEVWNQKMHCWVNKGAKGIALINKNENGTNKLKYVFDISDVHVHEQGGLSHASKPIPWRFESTDESKILEKLSEYLNISTKESFEENILKLSETLAIEYCKTQQEDFLHQLKTSMAFEELDDITSKVIFREVLSESVAYTVLARCGLNPDKHEERILLDDIVHFDSNDALAQLGTANALLSKEILLTIEKTVKSLNKDIAMSTSVEYNTLKRKSEDADSINGRSDEHGIEIQTSGGLYDTRYRIGSSRGGSNDRSVWANEKGISDGGETSNIQRTVAQWETGSTSFGNRESGEEKNRNNGDTGNGETRNNRSIEGIRPDGLGQDKQQHNYGGRGNGDQGVDLQLNIIKDILRNDSYMLIKKADIVSFYLENITKDERKEFIKNAYNGDYSGIIVNGHTYGYLKKAESLLLWEGNYLTRGGEKELSWDEIERHISIMISEHEYFEEMQVSSKPTPNKNYKYEQLSMFPTYGQQKDAIEIKYDNIKTKYSYIEPKIETVPPDDYIVSILKKGSGFVDGRRRILKLYQIDMPAKERAILIKKEYGMGGGSWPLEGNGLHGYDTFKSQGMHLQWKDDEGEKECYVSWYNVEEEIKKLILNKEYLSEGEKRTIGEENVHIEMEYTETQKNENEASGIIADECNNNYVMLDDSIGGENAKTKFVNNVMAINLLKQIEQNGRTATTEEQKILSKYVGWGGLSQAFDKANVAWRKEYEQLVNVLEPKEYVAARESTLNAFYTSPKIIKYMYVAISKMGFTEGNILEPSMGIGNFLGAIPENLKSSNLYGIEMDVISGGIAKQLYQNANIEIMGFEKSDIKNDTFDIVIGNVPFGNYKISDKKYNKNNFLVHDYFFAKALDVVRPNGVVAFITSKGTLDKANSSVRKYIAQRAELLGAIRLPNNAFLSSAGASVTSDIIFLQKRARMMNIEPEWVHLDKTDRGLTINSYFVENPHMVLGTLELKSGQYGKNEIVCTPVENSNLEIQLESAIQNIKGNIENRELGKVKAKSENIVPADSNTRNYSYCILDDEIYFRENASMRKIDMSELNSIRVKGMIDIRDVTRELIYLQANGVSDESLAEEQIKLNKLYDYYIQSYGLLNSKANKLAFSEDASYPLLMSLEIFNEENQFVRKADMFTKRTIGARKLITAVATAGEALAVSISEKAKVDVNYMSELTGIHTAEIIESLRGVIYRVSTPNEDEKVYVTADEYLSGNIRKKLAEAKLWLQTSEGYAHKEYLYSISALESALPTKLEASEIDVRLGATWIPEDVINSFMHELMEANRYVKNRIEVKYSPITNEWVITNKSSDSSNVKAINIYGTRRINAYRIIEETLNLKDVRVMDLIEQDGVQKRVLNKMETTIAQQKQEIIKNAFVEWIWKDQERRSNLAELYNQKFNSIRTREYDGSHIKFANMNPEISLNEHQVNAVARIMYGGNTLLAHVVGAGKTFEMVAAAQESKRLGLCNKSLFVVPNHLTEQWGSEYLRLYPSANILVTTKKDFEKANRKRFCSRIATGEYDAVIMGHSQFEKIPMSEQRQEEILNVELREILDGIEETKRNKGDNLTVKQLERVKKGVQIKLEKLHDTERKDDIVNFEELGIDRIFIDEAHYFKNLFLYTKMRNVAGISQTEANKSSDLFMKCKYLDEITDGRGIIFATGTPISNSMTEMYTMQRYLQNDILEEYGLQHFDAWASTFGETMTAIELAPEGSGYRAKTRFAKFFNLPELMTMFREVADIKTSDMLALEVPTAEFETMVLKPSEYQKQFIETLSIRADRVRKRMVEPNEDNMLRITNDGRKLALDQRLMDKNLPDFEDNKTTACANKVFEVWKSTKKQKSTQLIFCDISTPHFDGEFNVYDDIKEKLIGKGIQTEEIQFIHSAKTDKQKEGLFSRVRNGTVRVLLGSTQKMGAGTNIQDKLIAIHDLDCPWRPSDLEQRSGRLIRRGNQNKNVYIFRYVTENTFDSYLYQLVENKQRFIGQIMTSKSPARSAEDIDEATLSYAEIKALATGNPLIKEKMDLEIAVSRLKVLRSAYLNNKYTLEDAIMKKYPESIQLTEEKIQKINRDIIAADRYQTKDFKEILINDVIYREKEMAGNAILDCIKKKHNSENSKIGNYKGFDLYLGYDASNKRWKIMIKGELHYNMELGKDVFGNITRLDNAIASIPKQLTIFEEELINFKRQSEIAKSEIEKSFLHELEFKAKTERLAELDILLNLDNDKLINGVVETWDISLSQDKSVIAVLKKSNKDETNYALEFSGEGEMQDFKGKPPWDEESHLINELIISDGITNIGANACIELKIKLVQLASSVMSIGEKAFEGCTELERADLGNGIKRVKKFAFNRCIKLEKVSGCNNLLCIEDEAFGACNKLEQMDYGDNCKVDKKAFAYCSRMKESQESKTFDISKFKNKTNSGFKLER